MEARKLNVTEVSRRFMAKPCRRLHSFDMTEEINLCASTLSRSGMWRFMKFWWSWAGSLGYSRAEKTEGGRGQKVAIQLVVEEPNVSRSPWFWFTNKQTKFWNCQKSRDFRRPLDNVNILYRMHYVRTRAMTHAQCSSNHCRSCRGQVDRKR